MELRLKTTDSKIWLCRRPLLDQKLLQASLNPKVWLLSGGQAGEGSFGVLYA